MENDVLRHWYHGALEFIARVGVANDADLARLRYWLEAAQREHSGDPVDARAIGHLIAIVAEYEGDSKSE